VAVRDLVFLGASTAFAEISEVVHDLNRVEPRYRIVAALDDDAALHGGTLAGGVPVAGGLDRVGDFPDALLVFGIGSFRTRMVRWEILRRLGVPDERFATLVHPGAKVYPGARVGPGCVLHSGVVVGNDVAVEPFAIITFNTVVGPYSRIGRCAMVTSSAVVLTGVEIGPCAFIGAGSCLAEGVRIGPGAMVGMATTVHRSVGPGAFVLGNPARVLYSVKVPAGIMDGWDPAPAGKGQSS
jgi:sugar O-acyltransferase (sialic acid O-acetyltransferase NeuD family)